MDPTGFLELAKILKSGPTPVNFRTAINRAYYAAFHVGVETLKAIGIRLNENSNGHGELSNCLGGCGDPDFDKASNRLKRLHSRRIQADYAIADAKAETRSEAQDAYLEAQQIVKDLDKLKNDPTKDAARSKMKQMARDMLHLPVN